MTTFPEQRSVILTGAASPRGIGRATAHFLAERGWSVGIIDLDESAAQAVAAEVAETHGVSAAGAGANVADEQQVRAAFDALEPQLPQLVALVNLAGVSSADPYLEVTPDEWNRVIGVNLNGVHYATRRAVETTETGRPVALADVIEAARVRAIEAEPDAAVRAALQRSTVATESRRTEPHASF
ncbi:SDR family NAD(P)-dependent oxidoreductase [Microbacterium paludicola]|uniref:SDR family NAD(P)-dependent oxidoreductase n=1 Tax=Microbacterium paludicola TaxID=300019 RepID=UPI003879BF13